MAAEKNCLLGVNIDHIATLRNARGTIYPEPVQAALIAEHAGADGITAHLREDRRHIIDRDIELLAATLQTKLNLEMAVTDEMVAIAVKTKPAHCCLVPEKREEVTTEGGLNVLESESTVAKACDQLASANIDVSLFIDPEKDQIDAAKRCGAPTIEIHTGAYADATDVVLRNNELARIIDAAKYAADLGLVVNAGHGLHYHNVTPIVQVPEFNELNIGHSIIARAVICGLDLAVRDMKELLKR